MLTRSAQLAHLVAEVSDAISPSGTWRDELPALVAGDFNDWGQRLSRMMAHMGLHEHGARTPTFPARLPLTQLDHVYARGLKPVSTWVPRGRIWHQMSDHLPLVADFTWQD